MQSETARQLRAIILAAALIACARSPALAIVGDAELAARGVAQHLVVVRSRASICTGTVLTNDLVLTAAHCLRSDKLQVRPYGERKFLAVASAVPHPQFERARADISTRVDLALLKLATPLPERAQPVLLGRRPTSTGEAVLVAGYGRHDPDSRDITGRARMATLITLERRLGVQLLLRDPTMQEAAQLGACGGDSGGPAFAVRDGLVVIGVVTAAPERCGGLTIVTPITPYYDWIVETARALGSAVEH